MTNSLVIWAGPPTNFADDLSIVKMFLSFNSEKIVCGGTTSNILARETNSSVEIEFSEKNRFFPPFGRIGNIALATEGYETLVKVNEILEQNISESFLTAPQMIVNKLNASGKIKFIVGKEGQANVCENLRCKKISKRELIQKIADKLKNLGKFVNIDEL